MDAFDKELKLFLGKSPEHRSKESVKNRIMQIEKRIQEIDKRKAFYLDVLAKLKGIGSSTPSGEKVKMFKSGENASTTRKIMPGFKEYASSTREGMKKKEGTVLGASVSVYDHSAMLGNAAAQVHLMGQVVALIGQTYSSGEVLGVSTAAAMPAPTLKEQLAVEQANLASLKKQVAAAEAKIAELTARMTAGDLGVYDLFKNGVIAKRTLNISKADALAQCMKVAMANRKDKFICQWGNNTTDTITLFNSAVDTLPAELSTAEIFKNGTFLKNVNDISSADTVTMCKDLAAIPSSSYQPVICYWKGKIVYNSTTDKPTTASYALTDVKSITKKNFDPIPAAVDDEYTEYTITLKSGAVHKVKNGFLPPGTFDAAVRATGYTGSISDLLKKATAEVAPRLSITSPIKNAALLHGETYRVTWKAVGLVGNVVNVTLENKSAQDHLALYVPAEQGYADITIPTTGPGGSINGAATLSVWVTQTTDGSKAAVKSAVKVVIQDMPVPVGDGGSGGGDGGGGSSDGGSGDGGSGGGM